MKIKHSFLACCVVALMILSSFAQACQFHTGFAGGWLTHGVSASGKGSSAPQTKAHDEIQLNVPTVLTVKRNKAFELPVNYKHKQDEALTIKLALEFDEIVMEAPQNEIEFSAAKASYLFELTPRAEGIYRIKVRLNSPKWPENAQISKVVYVKVVS